MGRRDDYEPDLSLELLSYMQDDLDKLDFEMECERKIGRSKFEDDDEDDIDEETENIREMEHHQNVFDSYLMNNPDYFKRTNAIYNCEDYPVDNTSYDGYNEDDEDAVDILD